MSPPRARVADLVGEERENLLILGSPAAVDPCDLLAHLQRVRPLPLFLVQLLQVDERVAVQWIEPHHLLERLERAIDEPAMAEVERETQLHVGLFELGQVRTLQQLLMHVDGAPHLALRAIEIAQDHLDLERIGRPHARRLGELLDRLIDLVVDEIVQAEHVMRRFT